MNIKHDHTSGDLCPCSDCEHGRFLRLACSRAQSALQQARWHPRSRRLREAAERAQAEYDALRR